MSEPTVRLSRQAIRAYLDEQIEAWRTMDVSCRHKRDRDHVCKAQIPIHYVTAFQMVRRALCGEEPG